MIDIRYIEILCDENQNIAQVTISDESIEIQKRSDGLFIETTVFPEIYHYLGFCISDEEITETPYFQLANGKKEKLFPIKVPGKKETWWIQNSGWDAINNRFYSEIFRTAGRYKLFIQNRVIEIENESFDLSLQDLEYYLNDFKNGLWNLILNPSSAASANISSGNGAINNNFLDLVRNVIDHTNKIIANPSAELHEIQANKPIRAAKPIPATFRELALRPNRKNVISRSFAESYNTNENRFIHYCVNRIYFLLKSLKRISEAQDQQLQHKIIQEKESLAQLQSMTHKVIDPVVYDNEIQKIQNDLLALDQEISSLNINTQNLAIGRYPDFQNISEAIQGKCTIKFGKNYGNSSNTFFCTEFNGHDPKKNYPAYMVIVVPQTIMDNEFVIQENTILKIIGEFTREHLRNNSGNFYWLIRICSIDAIELISSPQLFKLTNDKNKTSSSLTILKNKKSELEQNNWIEDLTLEEEKDRDMEISIANKKLSLFQNIQQQIEHDAHSLPQLLTQLKTCVNFFTSNNDLCCQI